MTNDLNEVRDLPSVCQLGQKVDKEAATIW